MDQKEHKIVSGAYEVFMKYGIKSVTMDDIAKQLGISKKTLYRHVSDKNDLLRKALYLSHKEEEAAINAICDKGYNAIDESFEVSKLILKLLKKVHPSIHYDLEKYHTEVWNELLVAHQEHIRQCIVNNLENGISEGYYRENLNIPIIANIYISRFDVVFDGSIFPPDQYNFPQVYLEMFRYHIRGIASEKGLKYLTEKVNKEKENITI